MRIWGGRNLAFFGRGAPVVGVEWRGRIRRKNADFQATPLRDPLAPLMGVEWRARNRRKNAERETTPMRGLTTFDHQFKLPAATWVSL